MSNDEKIIDALNRIEKALSSESWITILISVVGIICPIIMAIISYRLSKKTDKSNENLRKMLYNRDVENHTRDMFIGIYNTFFKAYKYAESLKQFEEVIFWNRDNAFFYRLRENLEKLEYSNNMFKLLNENSNEDDSMKNTMQSFIDEYSDLIKEIENYLNSQLVTRNFEAAYQKVGTIYGITLQTGSQLYTNNNARKEFIGCLNDTFTEDIKKRINSVCKKFEDGKYEKYFSEKAKIKRFQDIGD